MAQQRGNGAGPREGRACGGRGEVRTRYWFLRGAVWSRGLAEVILAGPFQLGMFCDSVAVLGLALANKKQAEEKRVPLHFTPASSAGLTGITPFSSSGWAPGARHAHHRALAITATDHGAGGGIQSTTDSLSHTSGQSPVAVHHHYRIVSYKVTQNGVAGDGEGLVSVPATRDNRYNRYHRPEAAARARAPSYYNSQNAPRGAAAAARTTRPGIPRGSRSREARERDAQFSRERRVRKLHVGGCGLPGLGHLSRGAPAG